MAHCQTQVSYGQDPITLDQIRRFIAGVRVADRRNMATWGDPVG
jgi:hypothetical protein